MTDAQKREERLTTAAQLQTETTNTRNTTRLQANGQLRRALLLEEQAARLAAFGEWPAARRLRHEARRLRELARGTRPGRNFHFENPVDVERDQAVDRLAGWAGRSAA